MGVKFFYWGFLKKETPFEYPSGVWLDESYSKGISGSVLLMQLEIARSVLLSLVCVDELDIQSCVVSIVLDEDGHIVEKDTIGGLIKRIDVRVGRL